MTEMTDNRVGLSSTVRQFVLHWGDMGNQWGVNRSVAQIHALLYLSERPLTAEDIADALGVARSNVSNSLRELLAWKLIRRVPVFADRRDHFEAETDLLQIVTRIAQGRKEREIDPAAAALHQVMREAERDPKISKTALARLQAMQAFIDTLNQWYEQMLTVPPTKIMALIKMGARVVTFLNLGRGRSKEKEAA
jgi:DNA-binding transcriptional regulator GbsR (MarR family)